MSNLISYFELDIVVVVFFFSQFLKYISIILLNKMNLALHFKQVIALDCTLILYNFYFGVCAPS
jgi:hypothetical protein